jgi:hypothetical protein
MTPLDRVSGNQSGNDRRIADLESAITNVTRLLGKVDDTNTAAALVAERRAMRDELEALGCNQLPRNVVPFEGKRRPPRP